MKAVELARLLKTDPVKAAEAIQAEARAVRIAAGEELPDDLRQDVEDGLISEERAKELARLRIERQVEAARADRSARDYAQARLNAAATAVSEKERELLAKDPDYGILRPLVHKVYELEVRKALESGVDVTDPNWAVAALDDVVKAIKLPFTAAKPAPKAVPPPPQAKASTSGTKTGPKTLEGLLYERIMEATSSSK